MKAFILKHRMRVTTTEQRQMLKSKEVDYMIKRNRELKHTYDGLKDENVMLRDRLLAMMAWKDRHFVVKPDWLDAYKHDKDGQGHTLSELPPHWERLDNFSLNFV